MEKKKALAYKNFVLEAEKAFTRIITEKENLDRKELNSLKRKFDPDQFDNMFFDFEDELKENLEKYNNLQYIKSYLNLIFNDACKFTIKQNEIAYKIIADDFEMEFLLKLYENINKQIETFNFLCEIDTDLLKTTLNQYLTGLLNFEEKPNEEDQTTTNQSFIFKNLKKEIETVAMSNNEKLTKVQNRLYDFLQWQKEYDTYNSWNLNPDESNYEITRELYPKFEDLCNLEIKRLEDLIKSDDIHTPAIKKPSEMKVASKKKTEVMKILSFMYDLKLFTDLNGKPLTNKQNMMEAFGEFLNEDFSAYSTSLTTAKGGDYDNFFRIFEDLKSAAKNYIEKEPQSKK